MYFILSLQLFATDGYGKNKPNFFELYGSTRHEKKSYKPYKAPVYGCFDSILI